MGPRIGNANIVTGPPHASCTSVPTLYQQHNNRFCITYSLASALFYCNFVEPAKWLAECARPFSQMDFDMAISELRELMQNFVPLIGLPTIYGRKTKRHNRFKREMPWDDLFCDITPYPTLVIPVLPNGDTSHALCVVDDLIFDSITQFALRLHADSVKWIFNDSIPDIFLALRFQTKIPFSPLLASMFASEP